MNHTETKARAIAAVEVEGHTQRQAAEAVGVSVRTVKNWLAKYRAGELESVQEFVDGYRKRAAVTFAEVSAKALEQLLAGPLIPTGTSSPGDELARIVERMEGLLDKAAGKADLIVETPDKQQVVDRLMDLLERRRAAQRAAGDETGLDGSDDTA